MDIDEKVTFPIINGFAAYRKNNITVLFPIISGIGECNMNYIIILYSIPPSFEDISWVSEHTEFMEDILSETGHPCFMWIP